MKELLTSDKDRGKDKEREKDRGKDREKDRGREEYKQNIEVMTSDLLDFL